MNSIKGDEVMFLNHFDSVWLVVLALLLLRQETMMELGRESTAGWVGLFPQPTSHAWSPAILEDVLVLEFVIHCDSGSPEP